MNNEEEEEGLFWVDKSEPTIHTTHPNDLEYTDDSGKLHTIDLYDFKKCIDEGRDCRVIENGEMIFVTKERLEEMKKENEMMKVPKLSRRDRRALERKNNKR